MKNVIEELQKRGFIDAITDEQVRELTQEPIKVYCGFDPTSDSLHLGNLVAIMGLAWFQRFGHSPVAVVGGATGMVGDPSGKSKERTLLDEQSIQTNLAGIRKNLEAVLDFNHPTASAEIVNNYDWYKGFGIVDFLREVGKYFRVSVMLSKESVKARINSDEGISYTEFSYQILQAYDFLRLYEDKGVRVQLGGSDQWGNITAGSDLIRKANGGSVCGVTFPLLTRSDGKKFGKTEGGAIWLSADKLSPYDFYQYLFNIPDADVIKLMRMLTFMELDEIAKYEQMMQETGYAPNTAQKRLAEEVTMIVHGEEGVRLAQSVTQSARPGAETTLDAATLQSLAEHIPSQTLAADSAVDCKLLDILVDVGLQSSKGEARRLIRNGGAYLNNQPITDEQATLKAEDLIEDSLFLLSVGKKRKMVVRVS